jgi:hypothetical protein
MGAQAHREVIDGYSTVTEVRRKPGSVYRVQSDPALFPVEGADVALRRRPGSLVVECRVYAHSDDDPVAVVEFPDCMRSDLSRAAREAVRSLNLGALRK